MLEYIGLLFLRLALLYFGIVALFVSHSDAAILHHFTALLVCSVAYRSWRQAHQSNMRDNAVTNFRRYLHLQSLSASRL
jgi:hypothetical protein